MIDVAKRILQLPCSVGTVHVQTSMPELVLDSAFSTAAGLVLWGFEAERQQSSPLGRSGGMNMKSGEFMNKLSSPFKKIFKSFIP
jgi:hypothetical protein